MLIQSNATKTVNSHSIRKLFMLMAFSLFSSTQVTASELNTTQYSVSQGVLKKSINQQQRQLIIEENKRAEIPDQLNGKATSKTRATLANASNKVVLNANRSNTSQKSQSNYYADFTIYSAVSFLHDDYDGDGFYQTFSVTFDADIYSYTNNPMGEVYALLYLSKNGGPWTHYFTTDTFIIEGESDLDEYEVISTFMSGYATDHYDVLIDLYQVGYTDVVASLSSNDTDALYALPIESAEYDKHYVEEVEINGGSMFGLILPLLIVLLTRKRNEY
ncbi:MAG: choice-of-anchor H family protein [Alteromonadaceae bacterium]|jgi:hypothetical protein